jgi:hypothetical protein
VRVCGHPSHGYRFVIKEFTEVGASLPRPGMVISEIVLTGYIQPAG